MSILISELAAHTGDQIEEGRFHPCVAYLMGINQSSVSRDVKRFNETGEYTRKPIPGPPRCTMPVEDLYLHIRLWHVTARQYSNIC